jgi:hypothetical protein
VLCKSTILDLPKHSSQTLQDWTTPKLVVLDVNLINQEAIDQEAKLLNYLATDENTFKLFTGSTTR